MGIAFLVNSVTPRQALRGVATLSGGVARLVAWRVTRGISRVPPRCGFAGIWRRGVVVSAAWRNEISS